MSYTLKTAGTGSALLARGNQTWTESDESTQRVHVRRTSGGHASDRCAELHGGTAIPPIQGAGVHRHHAVRPRQPEDRAGGVLDRIPEYAPDNDSLEDPNLGNVA